MGRRSERARRPFWLHQAAEYVLGILLVLQGLQMPVPVVPAGAGLLVLFNAACARGPLGAFRLAGRRAHRIADLVVLGVLGVLAVQPVVSVEVISRALLAMVAAVLAVVWWYTDFDERPERAVRRAARAGPRSEQVGRVAGRAAGNLASQWSRRRDRDGA